MLEKFLLRFSSITPKAWKHTSISSFIFFCKMLIFKKLSEVNAPLSSFGNSMMMRKKQYGLVQDYWLNTRLYQLQLLQRWSEIIYICCERGDSVRKSMNYKFIGNKNKYETEIFAPFFSNIFWKIFCKIDWCACVTKCLISGIWLTSFHFPSLVLDSGMYESFSVVLFLESYVCVEEFRGRRCFWRCLKSYSSLVVDS